jgi:hypothetical protein
MTSSRIFLLIWRAACRRRGTIERLSLLQKQVDLELLELRRGSAEPRGLDRVINAWPAIRQGRTKRRTPSQVNDRTALSRQQLTDWGVDGRGGDAAHLRCSPPVGSAVGAQGRARLCPHPGSAAAATDGTRALGGEGRLQSGRAPGSRASRRQGGRDPGRPPHPMVRRRERKRQGFKSPGSAQRFRSRLCAVPTTFNVQRHLIARPTRRLVRAEASGVWQRPRRERTPGTPNGHPA